MCIRIDPQRPGFEGKPMSKANVAQVQSLYAAFGRGDIATLIAGLSPDVDWETVGRTSDFPTLGPRKGAGAVQEFFKLVADNGNSPTSRRANSIPRRTRFSCSAPTA